MATQAMQLSEDDLNLCELGRELKHNLCFGNVKPKAIIIAHHCIALVCRKRSL